MFNMFDLTGKTAIVTGSSTGLGQGMSIGLAASGAEVLLVDYVASNETAEEIKKIGGKCEQLVVNLMLEGATQEVFDKAIAVFGKVDILVNNAGIIRRTPAIDFSEKDWDEVMYLNSKVPFLLSQLVAKDMVKRNYGKIINVASLLAFQGGILVPSYAASKGAIAQLTKAFANEWTKLGITVNAIAPGYMATNNTTALRADSERSEAILARIPAGRWGTPKDIQGAAVFLASPASDYISGHVLVIDGAWMAR